MRLRRRCPGATRRTTAPASSPRSRRPSRKVRRGPPMRVCRRSRLRRGPRSGAIPRRRCALRLARWQSRAHRPGQGSAGRIRRPGRTRRLVRRSVVRLLRPPGLGSAAGRPASRMRLPGPGSVVLGRIRQPGRTRRRVLDLAAGRRPSRRRRRDLVSVVGRRRRRPGRLSGRRRSPRSAVCLPSPRVRPVPGSVEGRQSPAAGLRSVVPLGPTPLPGLPSAPQRPPGRARPRPARSSKRWSRPNPRRKHGLPTARRPKPGPPGPGPPSGRLSPSPVPRSLT